MTINLTIGLILFHFLIEFGPLILRPNRATKGELSKASIRFGIKMSKVFMGECSL